MLDLVFNNFTDDGRKIKAVFFKKIIKKAIETLGLDFKQIEISVNLVGTRKIRTLNQKYRGKDKHTDVLSFPVNSGIDEKSAISGIINAGDIFICLPIAQEDALRERVSLNFKLAFLAVHGFLHLLGYDHEKSGNNKKVMFGLQEKILKNIAL